MSDQIRKWVIIEESMVFIEESAEAGKDITEYGLGELHAIAVRALLRQADITPRGCRQATVQISQSDHVPPEAVMVPPHEWDLLKVALAHHRCA